MTSYFQDGSLDVFQWRLDCLEMAVDKLSPGYKKILVDNYAHYIQRSNPCSVCRGGGLISYEENTGVFLMPADGIMTRVRFCPWCGRKLEL